MIGKRICGECFYSVISVYGGHLCSHNKVPNEAGSFVPGPCKYNKNGTCRHYKVDRDKVNQRINAFLKKADK